MILLTSDVDLIQIVTGNDGPIDVHASYMDFDSQVSPLVATPGRKNTNIGATGTYTVIPSPLSGARNMKTLHIYNPSDTITTAVLVQHTDGTNTVILHGTNLAPGETLQYTDGMGFMHL